jgi:hypothetical protein
MARRVVRGFGRVARKAKYSENRDFAPDPTVLPSKIKRYISWLDPKFVTRRINGIFSPINEFRPV